MRAQHCHNGTSPARTLLFYIFFVVKFFLVNTVTHLVVRDLIEGSADIEALPDLAPLALLKGIDTAPLHRAAGHL